MVFKPGNIANPLGRPKRRTPHSEDYQAFCKQHHQEIKKVGEIALRKAVEGGEPWAIKLCMEYFYPKPERSVAVTKEETTDINVNIGSFTQSLSFEDKREFLRMWMKSKRGTAAFASTLEGEVKTEGIDADMEVSQGTETDQLVALW